MQDLLLPQQGNCRLQTYCLNSRVLSSCLSCFQPTTTLFYLENKPKNRPKLSHCALKFFGKMAVSRKSRFFPGASKWPTVWLPFCPEPGPFLDTFSTTQGHLGFVMALGEFSFPVCLCLFCLLSPFLCFQITMPTLLSLFPFCSAFLFLQTTMSKRTNAVLQSRLQSKASYLARVCFSICFLPWHVCFVHFQAYFLLFLCLCRPVRCSTWGHNNLMCLVV